MDRRGRRFLAAVLLLCAICALPQGANGSLSRRAKCSIECYIKCANSGTPKAVYCNCPLTVETEPCNSVSEHLLTEKTLERQIESDSGYKDIRTVWLRIEPVPAAFIYVFEFSIQNADRPIWIFAGASSSPQVTFSLPDACRDYQFRAIVVLRSTDPMEQLVVFRPKAIPARFPAFAVPKESIHLDQPKQSNDGQTLHMSVSWQHPFGYDDADVYGYSPPTAYPIRCQTPEDRLSQPRLELVQGGARIHLALPVDVLQERCRIFLEVRMLPRCVRIDPFDIQVSVELDCQKFPQLRYCQKEQSPRCTDVVDLWGKDNGKAIVVWQRPEESSARRNSAAPAFYVVNWGPAQSDGSPPLVTRRIVQSSQLRVPGNQTNAELAPAPGVQYGLQICAFFAETQVPEEEESPFRLVPVIPFTCTHCANNAPNGSCIDCSKIEESTTSQAQTTPLAVPSPRPVDCVGAQCAASNRSSVHFISSDTVVLDVFGANVSAGQQQGGTAAATTTAWTTVGQGRRREEATEGAWIEQEGPLRQRHSKTHWPDAPIQPVDDLEVAAEAKTTAKVAKTTGIGREEGTTTAAARRRTEWHRISGDTLSAEAEQDTTLGTTTSDRSTMRWPPFRVGASSREGNGGWTPLTSPQEQKTTPAPIEMSTAVTATAATKERGTTSQSSSPPPRSSSPTAGPSSTSSAPQSEARTVQKYLAEVERRRSKGAAAAEPQLHASMLLGRNSALENIARVVEFLNATAPVPSDTGTGTEVAQSADAAADRVNVAKAEQCRLRNGIWCESGCDSEQKCECRQSEVCIRGALCPPPVGDLRAQFEPGTRTLRLFSAQLNRALRRAGNTHDRLHLEFGELGTQQRAGFADKEAAREHWMLDIKDLDMAGLFLALNPFSAQLERQLDVHGASYGLSVCALNSSLVPLNLLPKAKPRQQPTTGTPTTEREKASTAMARAFDAHKWILAAPAFFLFGLILGLALFCTVLVRRRKRRGPLHGYAASMPSTRKHGTAASGQRFPQSRSGVLAARTALMASGNSAGGWTGTGTSTMGNNSVGTTVHIAGGTSVTGSVPCSASSVSSGASSAATAESRIGGTPLGSVGGHPQQHFAFADNTARFFMHAPNSAHQHNKNVHF